MEARLVAKLCACARVFMQLWVHMLPPIAPSTTISSTTWHNRAKKCLLVTDLHTLTAKGLLKKN